MKLTKYFMPVAAVALLASCSDNQGVTTPDQTPSLVGGYAKVRIVMPSTGTRADEFDNGDLEECKVSSVVLNFYDVNGTYIGNATTEGLSLTDDNDNNLQKSDTKILEINAEETPTYVVAFINIDNVPYNDLTDLKNGVLYSGTMESLSASNNFPMTNVGYYDGSTYKMEAEVKKVYTSKKEAEEDNTDANVTIINVERLVSKVSVSDEDAIQKPEYSIVAADGKTPVTLEFTATGWGITGQAKSEYVVKKEFTSHKDENWTKGSGRSFWAEGVNYKTLNGWADYYGDNATTELLAYVTRSQLEDLDKEDKYAPEHTTELQITEDNPEYLLANSYVIVAGKYDVKVGDDISEDYQDADGNTQFYLTLSGSDENDNNLYTIYTYGEFLQYLVEKIHRLEVSSTANGDGTIDADTYDTYFAKKYDPTTGKYMVELAKDCPGVWYKSGEETWTEITEANVETILNKTSNTKEYWFEGGETYFNTTIYQLDNSSNPVYGLVRNHSYKLKITQINSLGAPVNGDKYPDDDTPIVPDPDELKNHFIKAQINVLDWHVVENNGVIL